jgi:hypothetical protein
MGIVVMMIVRNASIRLALVCGAAIAGALGAQAQIQGQTQGRTVSLPPMNPHPMSRDDTDTVTSMNITWLTGSALINQAAMAFPGTLNNLVYAGAAMGPGMNFTPFAQSDFNINTYTPWVVNSPNLVSPGGTTYNRGVVNQDAGGVNILITYTPGRGDPTTVNFLQAFSVTSPNLNGGMPIIAMDNGGRGGPYYNQNGASGTDANDTNGVPLNAMGSSAWMLDTPYVCESGFGAMGMGCPATTPMTDEFIPSYVDVFNMFIESNQVFMGTTYQVLFGGFSWGFTYTATDVPEPSTWAMVALGFAGLGAIGYRQSRKPAAATATA